MKTNYLPRNNKRSEKPYRRLILLATFLVLGAAGLSLSDGWLSYAAKPIWSGKNIIGRGALNSLEWFRSKEALIRNKASLEDKLASQEAELASLRDVKERELELLSMLGRPSSDRAVFAAVLVRPPETPYDIIVIDAGSNQGLEEGSPVSLPEGPLLGRVSEVQARTSKVRLYSSDGEKTNAVLERHGLPVTLMGQGGGNFKLVLPRDAEVEVGDRILSADVFAELIAVVGEVNMRPTDSFKEVLARGAANLFDLRFVMVEP